jgi:GLPGLI family protein
MKHILLIVCLVLPLFGHAQPTEGRVRYLIVHNWSKKMAAVDYLSKQQRDRVAYMWGNRSEWKEYANLYFNQTETKYEDSEERAEPEDEGYSWRKETFFIKRNFQTNMTYDGIETLGKTYIVQDTMRPQNWKIHNDLKEVAGHICMKAFWEDTLKKQKIVAWFAQDIPMPAGPDRFFGLPGLILEIDMNDGAQLITANLIEEKKLATELDPPKKLKGKKVSEADFAAVIKKHMDEKRKAEQPWFWGIRY